MPPSLRGLATPALPAAPKTRQPGLLEEAAVQAGAAVQAEAGQHSQARWLSPAQLGRLVRDVAAAGEWLDRAMFCTDARWFHRLELTANYEIWLLSWLAGQHTGFHDHGAAAGAFVVAQGELQETLARPGSRKLRYRPAVQGTVRMFSERHLHDLGNVCETPAISVHAYSPPLTQMRRYEMTASGLGLVRTDHAELDW